MRSDPDERTWMRSDPDERTWMRSDPDERTWMRSDPDEVLGCGVTLAKDLDADGPSPHRVFFLSIRWEQWSGLVKQYHTFHIFQRQIVKNLPLKFDTKMKMVD